MLTLFWLALVLGGGLAVFSLLGDFFDASADHLHIAHEAEGDADWQLLSMRSATYFLFAFGAAGLLSGWTGANTLLATAVAVFCGITAAVAGAAVFKYLRSTNSGALEGDQSYEGLQARVVLPLRSGRGKISVTRAGRDIELMAECFDSDADHPENWKDVVIVELRGGTALVSPMYQFERTDALLPPATE